MKQYFFIILMQVFILPVEAFYFRSYQVEDGLSHNSVWSVMQDRRGFIWFGTSDGLNRFDGKSFKVFKKRQDDASSIGNNFIHCMKEDSRERFFVGTKNGLYLFDTHVERFSHIDLGRTREDDASINAIMEDPDGSIRIACHGQGLYVLNTDLSVRKHYYNSGNPGDIPSNYIWNIVQDYTGNFWLASAGEGLIFFDSKKETFTRMNGRETLGITDQTVYSLYCDAENNLWIGTASSGLYRYNYRTGKLNCYMSQQAFNIKSITEYSDSELIMGSDKGLVVFNRTSDSFEFLNNDFDNLTDKSIFSIIRDTEGAFWIGTYFGGVNYFSPAINKFFYYYSTPGHSSKKNIISSFAEDKSGKIWVGTYNGGLSLFNPATKRFEAAHYDVGYHDIQDLLPDNDRLYISLYGRGLSVLNTRTGKVAGVSDIHSFNFITTLFKHSKGYLLLGSEEGAGSFDPLTGKMSRIAHLAGMPIKDIEEDYKGNVWFATHANGVLRLDINGQWSAFGHQAEDAESLPTNNINCIFQDSRFRIWAGTEGEGLLLFNPEKNRFERFLSEESGLSSNIIYSMLDDNEGYLWVTTSSGLLRIHTEQKTVKTFGYIGDVRKIRYNPKSALKTSANHLYFGGTNGFISFNPKEISTNRQVPPVTVTGFRIANREMIAGAASSPLKAAIGNTKEITLKYNQSSFNFDFVALSYLSPDHNRYAYMLEGFDADWNDVGNDTKAHYMNIPAGNYVFRVKGANNDGVWNESGTSIAIRIKPPFWFENYMICLYIALALGVAAYLIYAYNRRLAAKNQEKLYKYKAEKEKETYESKINFFTNIAHEIRTPLSLIIAPLENILLSGDGSRQTRNNLEIIDINVNRLLDLINQLLDFRKVEENMFLFNFRKHNIVKIVQDVYSQYHQNARLSNIDMSLSMSSDRIESIVDSEAIYKIVSNLVSNAIKYASERIEIRLGADDKYLSLSVKDDGAGLDKQYWNKIFEPFFRIPDKDNVPKTGSGLGLSLSQSLAAKHNGSIAVESEPGKGSVFTLKLPIASCEEGDAPQVQPPDEEKAGDSSLKILVVEDNKDLRSFLVSNLNENHIILEAENGRKAMEIVEKESLDVIISDILMPEMDGLELCNAIKTNLAYSHIPLILLSAKTDTQTKIEGLKKGADVYLEKPFSIEQLKAQVNSIIENRNNLRNNFIQSPLNYFKQKMEKPDNREFIEKLNACIIENMSDDKFTIDSLSERFFISRSNLHKKIKNITGITPNDYIKLIRLNQGAQMLATTKYKINEVCYLVGFETPSYFSKCFYEHFGILPKDFMLSNSTKTPPPAAPVVPRETSRTKKGVRDG
ncbi:MAG: response regulator [Dysgonamonadaceae bacterium]|jgi:signal transduction histidine kinase/ligand-binding sensor domain-containing protein/DNA-binding response OmpR family regulator|nr:response regulator [Dysgonamonadaceae bacterium]